MPLLPAWRLRLVGLLLVGCVAVGGALRLAHRPAPATPADVLVATVARATVAATRDSGAHESAARVTDAATAVLHRRIVIYDTVRARVILDPASPTDTAFDIALLPGLVRAGDSLKAAAVRDSVAWRRERASAAALDDDRRTVIAAQDTLLTILRRRPRLAGVARGLYDPIAHVPGIAASVEVRAVGAWSVGLAGEYRAVAGERPRGYVTLSHPLF